MRNMQRYIFSIVFMVIGYCVCLGYYITPGEGTTYTMKSLSTIHESGIIEDSGIYTVRDTIEIAENDVLMLQGGEKIEFQDNSTIFISGKGEMAPKEKVVFFTGSKLVTPGYVWIKATGIVDKIENIDFNAIPVIYFPAKPVTVRCCSWDGCIRDAICFRSSTEGVYVEDCEFNNLAKSAIRNPAGMDTSTGALVKTNNEITIKGCRLKNIGLQQVNFLPAIDIMSGGQWKVTIIDNTLDGGGFPTGGIRVLNFMTYEGDNEVEIARNEVKNCTYGIFVAKDVEAVICDNVIVDNRCGDMKMNTPGFGGFGICVGDNKAFGVEGRNGAKISGNTITGHLWGITTNGKKCMCNAGNVSVDETSYQYNPGKNIIYDNGCIEADGGYIYHPGHPIGFYNDSANEMWAQYNKWGKKEMTEEEVAAVIVDKADLDLRGTVNFMPLWNGEPDGVAIYENSERKSVVSYYSITGIRLRERPSSGLYIERDSCGKSILRMGEQR